MAASAYFTAAMMMQTIVLLGVLPVMLVAEMMMLLLGMWQLVRPPPEMRHGLSSMALCPPVQAPLPP